jgi:hypothetical protein
MGENKKQSYWVNIRAPFARGLVHFIYPSFSFGWQLSVIDLYENKISLRWGIINHRNLELRLADIVSFQCKFKPFLSNLSLLSEIKFGDGRTIEKIEFYPLTNNIYTLDEITKFLKKRIPQKEQE